MPDIDENVFTAFREELRKVADVPWQLLGRTVGSGFGAGALGGAAIGGGLGALHGWRDARAEGDDVVSSALHALGGGAKGGLKGGALGALGGGALGAAGAIARPELAARAAEVLEGAPGALGAASRFGQRQVHSLTGWEPEGGIGAIRGGAWDQRHNADLAKKGLEAARAGGNDVAIGRAAARAGSAQKARGAAEEVERRGMTSLPGSLRAMRADPLGAISAGAKHQWHGSSKLEKAVLLGLPAMQLTQAAASNDPNKGERIGENLGGIAGGLAFGGAPLAGQIAGGLGAGAIGKLVGHGYDRMRRPEGVVNRKPELEPVSNEQHIPVERNMSNAAMGQPPEGFGG
jgi:hypothetical protein